MVQPAQARQIGRFQVVETLGQGAQGTVFLAEDPHLQRYVAIKTIHLAGGPGAKRQISSLLDEARIVSRLQHPNIVALYDAGEWEEQPYLVFEYVQGTTLSSLLKGDGLSKVRAVEIMMGILEGMLYAHQQEVVHRDLKPSNVIVDRSGVARIMDFGIARRLASGQAEKAAFQGTPLYTAPEYVSRGSAGPQADIFSVGMMFYEALAGVHPVQADSLDEVLRQIAGRNFEPPSRHNAQVEEKLDSIVMKAIAKDPLDRFDSAGAMLEALRAYLRPAGEAAQGGDAKQSTIDFLLRRMRHKSDFPALSQAISAINRVAASDSESVAALSNVVLRDFALTNKLLKLVNTAYYGQFGGSISTVSRAVVIMGFDAVRNVAITLMLFEHLQNKSQAIQLKDQTIASFFQGIVAREIAAKTGVRDKEEAFICAMFHNLGKLLGMFYFHEETVEIEKLLEQGELTERKASAAVLGVSYEELGVGIARSWHFPDKIISSMRKITEDKVKKPETDQDRLRLISTLSHDLCVVAGRGSGHGDKAAKLRQLSSRFGGAMGMNERALSEVVEGALEEFLREARILEVDARRSQFLERVARWSGRTAGSAVERDADTIVHAGGLDADLERTVLRTDPGSDGQPVDRDSQAVLAAGIQDITNTLVSDYSLNDLLRMVLETMYRAMDFSSVLLCIKDSKHNLMQGRFGFGDDVEALLKIFKFPLTYTPDVFHVSVAQGLDILIDDVDAESISARIPDWYRRKVGSASFMLFPVVVDKAPIGLFYADQKEPGRLQVGSQELSLLKTLRNQAVLAIKQKM